MNRQGLINTELLCLLRFIEVLLRLPVLLCLDSFKVLVVQQLLLVEDAHLSLNAFLAAELHGNEAALLRQDFIAEILIDELLLELGLCLQQDLLLKLQALKRLNQHVISLRNTEKSEKVCIVTFTFIAFSYAC